MPKILVAMSGGVDSSVAAAILKEEYQTVEGAYLILHDGYEKDVERAKKAAEHLAIPLHVIDGRDYFQKTVIEDFVTAYEDGKTPNPCVYCNRNCKFALLLGWAFENGFDRVATGHYARRVILENGNYAISKGRDRSKDQSYMLYQLTQEQLSKIMFPLGELLKTEVREIAEDLGLENAQQRDSQDICFIPDGDYAAFLEQMGIRDPKNNEPGNFVDTKGNILGKHKGLIHYTIGQRKGLGLSLPAPLYVCEKRKDTNEVVLCPNEELFHKQVIADQVHLMALDTISAPLRITAKIRYSQGESAGTALLVDEKLIVLFDEGVRAPTPGQSLVLYDEEIVLGGGIIV